MDESIQNEVISSPTRLERVPELWFEDGTIILQAGSKTFRVYKGLLAARAPLFVEMMPIPEPVEEGEVMEGCPVVRLDDSAEDVRYFLRCIHDFK
jgi:hypothetical protein